MRRAILVAMLCYYPILLWATIDSSVSPNSTENTSTNNQSNNLVSEMNKKTKKALKAFKGLSKDNQQSKDDFFDTIGQSPTSADFEGQTGEDVVVQKKFKFSDEND